jgi:FKBP-type peptidyl-prolyl cis-trans isomerase 2
MMKAEEGKIVTIHYTLKLENGRIFESTEYEPPMSYTHGSGEIVSGMEKGIEGMEVGESKSFVVKPKDGYGEVTLDSLLTVPREHVPQEAREVGSEVTAMGPKGQQITGIVYEVRENTLVVDFNHPLAGVDLYFDVSVISIEDAP